MDIKKQPSFIFGRPLVYINNNCCVILWDKNGSIYHPITRSACFPFNICDLHFLKYKTDLFTGNPDSTLLYQKRYRRFEL